MKTIVILQSNYLPWKGYFDLINDADIFMFCDELQYTKKDWRNRNKIKEKSGSEWITIPVGTHIKRLICEVSIQDHKWQKNHWDRLQQFYSKTPFFTHYKPFLEDFYLGTQWTNLSTLNQHLIKGIAKEFLGITTEFQDSQQYELTGKKLDRLINLIHQTEANCYISGAAAKSYIKQEQFNKINVELLWKDYSGYPEYPQQFPPFDHKVTILDLLFNVGPESPWYIWGWRKSEQEHHE